MLHHSHHDFFITQGNGGLSTLDKIALGVGIKLGVPGAVAAIWKIWEKLGGCG